MILTPYLQDLVKQAFTNLNRCVPLSDEGQPGFHHLLNLVTRIQHLSSLPTGLTPSHDFAWCSEAQSDLQLS